MLHYWLAIQQIWSPYVVSIVVVKSRKKEVVGTLNVANIQTMFHPKISFRQICTPWSFRTALIWDQRLNCFGPLLPSSITWFLKQKSRPWLIRWVLRSFSIVGLDASPLSCVTWCATCAERFKRSSIQSLFLTPMLQTTVLQVMFSSSGMDGNDAALAFACPRDLCFLFSLSAVSAAGLFLPPPAFLADVTTDPIIVVNNLDTCIFLESTSSTHNVSEFESSKGTSRLSIGHINISCLMSHILMLWNLLTDLTDLTDLVLLVSSSGLMEKNEAIVW